MFTSGRKSAGGGQAAKNGLSFIGGDVVVSGDVRSEAQLHIDGRVEGNVFCHTLIQGEGGTIAGNIAADTVHLSGLVDGTVRARLVALEPTARVTGDVTYETLSIAAGASIEGRLARRDAAAEDAASIEIIIEPAAKPAKAEKRPRGGVAEQPGLLPVPFPAAEAAAR